MGRLIDGYDCDKDGNRRVYYDCNPQKNTACKKSMCAYLKSDGGCSATRNRAAAWDGAKPFYIKLQGNTFVREYIAGDESNGSTFDSYARLRAFVIWCIEWHDRHGHWTKRNTIEVVASIVSGIVGSLLVLKLIGVI